MSSLSNITSILQAAGVASQSLPGILGSLGTVIGGGASAQIAPLLTKAQTYVALGNWAGVATTATELEGVAGLPLSAALVLEEVKKLTGAGPNDKLTALQYLSEFQTMVASSSSSLANALKSAGAAGIG